MLLDFRGLILFYCPTCDKVYTVFSNEPKKKLVCKVCHTTVDLPEFPAGVTCNCECGRHIRAVTNCEKPLIEFECKCGYPLTLEYHRAQMRYRGI